MKPLHAVLAVLAIAFCLFAVAPLPADAAAGYGCADATVALAEGNETPSTAQRVAAACARPALCCAFHPAPVPQRAAAPAPEPPHRPPD